MKLESVQTFIAIAEAGSISEACRRQGLSKSVVSERLAELERTLGVQLIQRTTRRLSLTEDGQAFLLRARRIAQEVAAATAEMGERRNELIGPLRVSAPVSFGCLHLGAALYPFLQQHPGIDLTLDLDDRFVDVEGDGYDAVIRHGVIRESWLVAVRIATSQRFLVASPTYLETHGTPRSLEELQDHRAILYANRSADWRFEHAGSLVSIAPRRALRVNNGLIMRDAALAGMGLTLLPTFMMHTALEQGALRIVDVGKVPERAELHVAHPGQQQPSARLRALIAHLKVAFGDPPYWDRCLRKD